MSTKINKTKFYELLRTLIRNEIEEASTTVSVGGDGGGPSGKGIHYDTPNAFESGSMESVMEDTRDVVEVKKLLSKLATAESRYRKVMYDLSDRLRADTVNHNLQIELENSYVKNVTKFMRDVIRITKKVK